MWVRLWVCKSDFQVWSREVELSRAGEEMLRALRFPPGAVHAPCPRTKYLWSGQAPGGQ